MKKRGILSVKEEQLLELLWRYNKPLTSIEILELPEVVENGWNETSVFRMINSLLNGEYIHVCGLKQNKTQYARKFETVLTKEEYAAKILFDRGMKKNSLAKIALALVKYDNENESQEESDELIDQLESIISELRKEKE